MKGGVPSSNMANREKQRQRKTALATINPNAKGKKPSLSQQADAARMLRGG